MFLYECFHEFEINQLNKNLSEREGIEKKELQWKQAERTKLLLHLMTIDQREYLELMFQQRERRQQEINALKAKLFQGKQENYHKFQPSLYEIKLNNNSTAFKQMSNDYVNTPQFQAVRQHQCYYNYPLDNKEKHECHNYSLIKTSLKLIRISIIHFIYLIYLMVATFLSPEGFLTNISVKTEQPTDACDRVYNSEAKLQLKRNPINYSLINWQSINYRTGRTIPSIGFSCTNFTPNHSATANTIPNFILSRPTTISIGTQTEPSVPNPATATQTTLNFKFIRPTTKSITTQTNTNVLNNTVNDSVPEIIENKLISTAQQVN